MDERRMHSRRRPSERAITDAHNEAVRRQLLDGIEHEPEAAPETDSPGHVVTGDERERVRAALRRAVAGTGRRAGRRGPRPVVSLPSVETEPEQTDDRPTLAERREWLKSRGVDVDKTDLVMHAPAKVGEGHTRTTFRPPTEYDHPSLTTTRRTRR